MRLRSGLVLLLSVGLGILFGLAIARYTRIGFGKPETKPETAVTKAPSATPSVATSSPANRYLVFANQQEPEYLDPGLAQGTYELNVVMALFDGLVEFDPKTTLAVPSGAEKWDTSPDGRIYTFYLRKNAVWSDGHPVTAHDYVYSWERVLNPKTGAQYAFAYFYIVNAEDYNTGKITDVAQLGFKAVDDYTLQVTLKDPTPFFVDFMSMHTFRPVPRQAVERHGNNWTRPENIVTNGAFLLKSWVPHKEIVVERNPTFWDAANVKLAGTKFLPLDDRETVLKMYEAGDVDVAWYLPAVKLPSLMQRPDLVKGPFLRTEFYYLNLKLPVFQDVRVRQALAMAIDRKTLCEKYLNGVHIPWASLTPSGLTGYMPPPGLEFNPTEAKRLFAEAGFADPATFPQLTILYRTDEERKRVAEVVQQMWKENLRITVHLMNEEWKVYLKDLDQKNYEIGQSSWGGDYLDPNTFLEIFLSTSTQNHPGWKNAEFDGLMAQAAKEANAAKRLDLLRQAEAVLLREVPTIPLYTHQKAMLVKPSVKGLDHNIQDIHSVRWMWVETQNNQ